MIMLVFSLEFLFNTEFSLAVGLPVSLVLFSLRAAFSPATQVRLVATAAENDGIDVVKFESSEFSFLTVFSVKAEIIRLSYVIEKMPEDPTRSAVVFNAVTTVLDGALRPKLLQPVSSLGRAVVIDFGLLCGRVDVWIGPRTIEFPAPSCAPAPHIASHQAIPEVAVLHSSLNSN